MYVSTQVISTSKDKYLDLWYVTTKHEYISIGSAHALLYCKAHKVNACKQCCSISPIGCHTHLSWKIPEGLCNRCRKNKQSCLCATNCSEGPLTILEVHDE